MTEEDPQMSPEQITETQKQQCIFCHIISGKVASKKVYEDDKCLAILDINPANPGHVLVLPKEHHSIMPLMPEEEISHISKVVKKISAALIRGLKAEGTNIFIANGTAAGQKAPHFMTHIIPRKKNDGVNSFFIPKNQIEPQDLDKLRAALKNKVNEQFGITEKDPIVVDKPEPEKVETTVKEKSDENHIGQAEEENGSMGHAVHEHGDGHEKPMFHIPPPQEDNEPENTQEDKADLDTISNMFN